MKKSKSIDWELSVKLANNKPELAQELLNLLIAELPQASAIIEQAHKSKNMRLLHQQVHKLHGASCYCGVPKLKELTATIETKLKTSDTETIDHLLEKLLNEIQQILTLFQNGNYQTS